MLVCICDPNSPTVSWVVETEEPLVAGGSACLASALPITKRV